MKKIASRWLLPRQQRQSQSCPAGESLTSNRRHSLAGHFVLHSVGLWWGHPLMY